MASNAGISTGFLDQTALSIAAIIAARPVVNQALRGVESGLNFIGITSDANQALAMIGMGALLFGPQVVGRPLGFIRI